MIAHTDLHTISSSRQAASHRESSLESRSHHAFAQNHPDISPGLYSCFLALFLLCMALSVLFKQQLVLLISLQRNAEIIIASLSQNRGLLENLIR